MVRESFLETLAIVVIAAALVVLVARRARMPTIVSYLAAGLLIGPGLQLVRPAGDDDALDVLGEVGIVLLLFLVGLELSLERIRQVGKVAVAAGLGQVVFTAAGGLLICLALGFGWIEALFLSTALTFSSTVVVVKLLDQKGELRSLYGRIAVGIFLVQDLVVIIVLTVLAGLGEPEGLTGASIAWGMARAFLAMAGLLLVALLAARRVLPYVFGWVERAPAALFLVSLAWCFALVLAAHALELSAEIGAFLAGLSAAQLPHAHDLRRRTHPLMSFFIAVFFVSLSARMQLQEASTYWIEAVVLSLFVLVGNPLIFMVIIARYGYSERTAFLTSVTVAQISELSFIFVAMGVDAGLLGSGLLALVAVVGVVTIALSAYMILYNRELYRWMQRARLLRVFRARSEEDEEPVPERLGDHVIVVGMNALGQRIARELHERGRTVLAIDTDPHKLAPLPCRTMIGDIGFESVLEDASLAQAALAVCALRIETTSKLFAYRCRELGVPVVLYAFDRAMHDEVVDSADGLIESRRATGRRIVEELASRGVVSP